MVWKLSPIFTDSVVCTLSKAIWKDPLRVISCALVLPEHLLPQSLCFWVKWSKCVFVPALENGSVLLGAPREGVIKSKKTCLITFP